jgi:outer membrane protein TolC
MFFKIYLIISIILSASATAYGEVVTFEDLATLIQANNRLVKAAGSTVNAYNERSPYLAQSFLPNFTASTGRQLLEKSSTSGMTTGQAYRLETYINLYNGSRDRLEEQVRRDFIDVATSELIKESSQQLLAARRYFWQILAIKSLIDLYDEAITGTESYTKSAKKRIDHGIATRSDLVQFELHTDTLQQDQKRLLLELDIAKSQLAVLIGSRDHVSLELKGNLGHPSHEPPDLTGSHLVSNPDVSLLKGRVETLRHQADQLQTSWRPQLDIFSDFGQPTYIDRDGRVGTDRQEWFLGLRLRLDLADAVTDQRESQARLSQAFATELKLEDHKAKLNAFVHELQSELPLRHELLHDAARNQQRAEDLLKLIADEYNRGIRNAAELLSAAEQRLGARRRFIEQTRDFYLTRSQLASLTGT